MTGILNIQMRPALGNKELNLKKVEHYIQKNLDKKLDLVVLPEHFSTGLDYNSFEKFPENENGGETIKIICEYAKKYNTNIVAGTVIEKFQDKIYNTCFIINRQGEIVGKYRKIHLYNYMGGTEGEKITSGDELVTMDLDFGRIGIAIGFDIRYPLHYRKLVQKGADIIVSPSAWYVPSEIYDNYDSLEFAKSTWYSLNRVRAFDNFVYIVNSNIIGKIDDSTVGIGGSVIVAPSNEIIADARDSQCAVYADIELDIAKYYKSIYPITSIE